MNKVITINLHGRAYQLEEPGYHKLRDYLDEAAEKLENDPDKQEIISDLEQAVAEKLDRFLNANKTVVDEKEVAEVIKEMGPVESSGESAAEGQTETSKSGAAPKRLYKIHEGKMISGVSTGLAAYFNVDVVLVRVAFVLLVLLTHGIGILVYLILMIVIPSAKTSAQKAAAYGEPFTAKEFVERAREEYSKFADKSEWKKWKRELKEKSRQARREFRAQHYQDYHSWFMWPLMGLLTAALTILWIIGLIGLLTTGLVFGLALPAALPLWIAILIWLCVYNIALWPIRAVRYATNYGNQQNTKHYHHHDGFFSSLIWLAFLVLAVWFTWHYIPAAHPALERVQLWWNHFVASIRK
jgi:phage shock protein PspC (stress-responsive transcriptional regulator)